MTPLVEIRKLQVRYGDHTAVRGIDLDIPRAGLTAILGPSGCGKTSLLRAIAGFERPTAGSVRIEGELVASAKTHLAPEKRRVGMVFQQGALFPHLTVLSNVLYGLRRRKDRQQRATAALRLVSMETKSQRYPDELSGGEQQRVALARALAPEPRIVLLDEPFASLDAALRRRLREEMRSILEKAGMTGVLVTHDQEEALSLADTVVVMSAGRILQVGSPDQIYHRPISLEVAQFVGDDQLISCHVEAGQARSVLGTVACEGNDGPGLLLARPEDLALLPTTVDRGCVGAVVRRSFYGHDLIDEVALAGGTTLQVRVLSSACGQVGEAVRVELRDKCYRVFSPVGNMAIPTQLRPGDRESAALEALPIEEPRASGRLLKAL